jgi:hypothetical protein
VVEKCLQFANEKDKKEIVDEILANESDDAS